MPVTIDGTSGITTPTYNGADTSEYIVPVTAFKNRIINGAMMIDQRNAGASTTPTTNATYNLDRWRNSLTQSSKYSVQQNAGSVTPPAGFNNYLGITSTSAYSITSGDIFGQMQLVEGLNVADLGWGTANASAVTMSFWVRSSLTGTFGGALVNATTNRSYPFTYTISSANTWEYKTITIAGDTSGTWLRTNGIGIQIHFGLGVGSTYSSTAGAWSAGEFYSATGATSVVGTNGATWYITGVQLEKGSTATSFDYRPYGTELSLCQRYYEKSFEIGTAPANNLGGDPSGCILASSTTTVGNSYSQFIPYIVIKRAVPTITLYNPNAASNDAQWYNSAGGTANGGSVNTNPNSKGFSLIRSGDTTRTVILFHYAASAEL